jgi:nicotinamide-nucleotide amidase
MEEVVAKLLLDQKKRLALAESCTGGLVASKLVSLSGISDVFSLGVVSYSNEAKIHVLGVLDETLKMHGAVSRETAIEMAKKAMEQGKK